MPSKRPFWRRGVAGVLPLPVGQGLGVQYMLVFGMQLDKDSE